MPPILWTTLLNYHYPVPSRTAAGESGYGSTALGNTVINTIETHLGKSMSVVHINQRMMNNGTLRTFNTDHKPSLDAIWAAGRVPMVTFGAWDLGTRTNNYSLRLAAIANGDWDTHFTTYFQQAAAWKHPILWRPWWEFNVNTGWGSSSKDAAGNFLVGNFPWCYGVIRDGASGGASTQWTNTSADFVNAWRHLKDLAVAQGATNIAWGFCPNNKSSSSGSKTSTTATGPLSDFWPGNMPNGQPYVDWMIPDAYQKGSSGDSPGWIASKYANMTQILRGTSHGLMDTWGELMALDPTGKIPMGIGETNISETDIGGRTNRGSYITEAHTTSMPTLPRFALVSWFYVWQSAGESFTWDQTDDTPDTTPGNVGNAKFDTTAVDFAAFKTAVASSNYLGPPPKMPADLTPLQAYTTSPPGLTVQAPTGSQIQQTSITFTYTSTAPGTTWATYGTTTAYGNSTIKTDTAPMSTNHTVQITGLLPGTLYHIAARSEDGWGNAAASVDFTVTTTAVAGDPVLAAHAAIAGRVAHWRLNDANKAVGATMTDVLGAFSGTYQAATGFAATDVPGIIPTSTSRATQFDGGSWGQVASAAALSPQATGPMVLSLVFLDTGPPAATEFMAGKEAGSPNSEYGIQRTSTGFLGSIWASNGATYRSATPGVTVAPNTRHLVTMAYDPAQTGAAQIKMWFDGTPTAAGAVGAGAAPTATAAIFTIAERGRGDQRFTGILQEVVLRNTTWTDANELSIYTAMTGTTVTAATSAVKSTATAKTTMRVVTAATAATKGTGSADARITVLDPLDITGVNVSDISYNAATINWTTDQPSDSQVDYGTTSAYGRSTTRNPIFVTDHSVRLTGLSPGTTYHFRVRSNPGPGGALSVSPDSTFQVQAAPSVSISQFQIVSIGPRQVLLSWLTDQPSDTQLDYGPSSTFGFQTPLDPTPTTTHTVAVTGLAPSTDYFVRARAHDIQGVVILSTALAVRTAPPPGRLYTWIEPNGTAHQFDPSADPALRVIQGARGTGSAPTQWIEDRVPQHDGPINRDVLYDAREIEVPLLVQTSDYGTLIGKLRQMRQWLNVKNGDGVLQIADPDGNVRQFTCRLKQGLEDQEGTDVSGPTWRKTVLVFRTSGSDPYARWPSALNFAYSQAAASASWFPIFPLTLGGAGIFANPLVVDPGDVDAEPVWTLVGPMTNPTLTNTTTGLKIALTTALLAGQSLTIDTRFRQKTILRNDGTKLFSALSNDSSLWTLAPGQNVLSVVTSGTNNVSQVQLSFTPRTL